MNRRSGRGKRSSEEFRQMGKRGWTLHPDRLNPIKQCVLCLYRVGFGFTTIAKLTRTNKGLSQKWVVRAGLKRAPRPSTPNILPKTQEQLGKRRAEREAVERDERSKARFTRLFLRATREMFIEPIQREREKQRAREAAKRWYRSKPERMERQRQNARLQWERKKNDAMWRQLRAAQVRAWRAKNPDKLKSIQRAWLDKNRDRQKEYRKRTRSKPGVKLIENLRKRLRAFVKDGPIGSTLDLAGCGREHLRRHIEAQFTGRMSWENYGRYWELDHVLPCAAFDLSNLDEQRRCFHWTNLRPLKAAQNREKSDKIVEPQQSLLLGA
jgi:hypothetical protein